MLSEILITSPSNKEIAEEYFPYMEKYIVTNPPSLGKTVQMANRVYALGGGAVIDTAKIMSKDKPCIAIPTTACGSTMTCWSVIWKEKSKETVITYKPILWELYKDFHISLPNKVEESTYYDCLCHILDSRNSKKRTVHSLRFCDVADCYLEKYKLFGRIQDLIDAGNYAGRAIQITGTNYYHALSYVLTLDYGLDHGQALKAALLKDKKYDWNKIIRKAQKYDKFYEVG